MQQTRDNEKDKKFTKQTLITKDNNYWFVCDFETITDNTDYYDKNKDAIVILAHSLK